MTKDEFRETFSAYGDASSASLIMDNYSGYSNGFGFVEMANNAESEIAIKTLNGTVFKERNITVNLAKPRGRRPSYGSRH